MARVSAPDLLTLLTLRLRTLADLETIATTTGLTGDSTAEELSGLAQRGWVRHREGRVEGWMLTPEGRDACAALLAGEIDTGGARADVSAAYERFLSVNQRLLDLCTDWQLREVGSIEAMASLLTHLEQVDRVGQAVCASLAAVLARFDGYGPRLATARDAVLRGEPDWLTRPTIDSYHTVWFELHENLLATLGLERGHEGASDSSSLQEAH